MRKGLAKGTLTYELYLRREYLSKVRDGLKYGAEVLQFMPKEVRKLYNYFRVNVKCMSVGKEFPFSKHNRKILMLTYSKSRHLFW